MQIALLGDLVLCEEYHALPASLGPKPLGWTITFTTTMLYYSSHYHKDTNNQKSKRKIRQRLEQQQSWVEEIKGMA